MFHRFGTSGKTLHLSRSVSVNISQLENENRRIGRFAIEAIVGDVSALCPAPTHTTYIDFGAMKQVPGW